MIGTDHLDRLTLHVAVEIRSRHLSGNERARTGGVGVEAAHIGEHPDLDNIIGNLGARRGRTSYCRSEAKHGELLSHLHSQWPTLHIAEMAGLTVGSFCRKGRGALRTIALGTAERQQRAALAIILGVCGVPPLLVDDPALRNFLVARNRECDLPS